MKIVWEEKDIQPGKLVSPKGITDLYMIGYIPGPLKSDTKYTLNRHGSDGKVHVYETKQKLCDHLSIFGYLPLDMIVPGYKTPLEI